LGIGDLDLASSVRSLSFELGMRLHQDVDIEVTGSSTSPSVLTLARETQTRSCVDSWRNLDLDRPLLLDSPVAMALPARIRDNSTFASAVGTGSGHREKTLTNSNLAIPPTGATRGRLRVVGAATTRTDRTSLEARDFQYFFGAKNCLFEG
jgi:hypothetical protein